MTNFMKNVNNYLSEMKIKQTYLSMTTGIEKNKLFQLLSGILEESETDKKKIVAAFGKTVDFFENDTCDVPEITGFFHNKIVFCTGKPTEKQEKIVSQLIEFMENVDEVMDTKKRFNRMIGE